MIFVGVNQLLIIVSFFAYFKLFFLFKVFFALSGLNDVISF